MPPLMMGHSSRLPVALPGAKNIDYCSLSYESTCDAPVLDEARPFQFGVNHHEGGEKEREGVRGQFRVIVN